MSTPNSSRRVNFSAIVGKLAGNDDGRTLDVGRTRLNRKGDTHFAANSRPYMVLLWPTSVFTFYILASEFARFLQWISIATKGLKRQMKQHEVTVPQIGLIAGTRAMLGAGIALLLSEKLTVDQRRAIGWTLVAVGALTTIPLVLQLFSEDE